MRGASDLYEISENDALALLRSYPFSEGVPLGKHFVRWELGSLEMEPAYNIAMCAIFLATTCPKFIHIQTPRFSDTEHLSIIKNTLDLPAYASLKARALTLLRA
ncbi:hypothetical protein H4R24_000288 [Coemansia sp. RSA 988]|nr:hypothetical protein H4R24_000288 [Coemansia sp. RSA 988]